MKKKFKTIIAMMVVLAISMSGMCMTSAEDEGDTDIVDLTWVADISATIDIGDLDLVFDLNTNGWTEDSFDGTNNLISVKNTSEMPLFLTYGIRLNDGYIDVVGSSFRLTNVNKNGELSFGEGVEYCVADDVVFDKSFSIQLDTDEISEAYLTVGSPDFSDGYQSADFNNEQIGQITVSLSTLVE